MELGTPNLSKIEKVGFLDADDMTSSAGNMASSALNYQICPYLLFKAS